MAGIDPAWLWLIGAALLAATELAVPGVFLVWIAGAALVTGLVTFVTGVDLPIQLILFGLLSIAMVVVGRRVYEAAPHSSTDPLLNDRAARLIGETVTVVTPISAGEGRVKVGDGVWSARGPDAAAGARVRIIRTEGSCLIVEPAEALPPR